MKRFIFYTIFPLIITVSFVMVLLWPNFGFSSEKNKTITKNETKQSSFEKDIPEKSVSFNFQEIEVRKVLQLIAGIAKFNIVISDSVQGDITLRLENVPWEEALDIVLKIKGLDKRQKGNIIWIGPAPELSSREKLELETVQQVTSLAPLKLEYRQMNYAKAEEVALLLKEKSNSLLSLRGSVTVDKRTNTLLIQDTEEKLNAIQVLLSKLDVPVRQVLIETQIVETTHDLGEALGIKWGGHTVLPVGKSHIGIAPSLEAVAKKLQNKELDYTQRLFMDLSPSEARAAHIGIGFLSKIPNGTLLDLELQALEKEFKSKTVARPKLLTLNQNKATVEQGLDIPYQETSASGATSTSFKKAALKLDVIPQITPDDNILLDLAVSQDTIGEETRAGPAIRTKQVHTKVLVANGETVILGGIFSTVHNQTLQRVPLVSKLPIVGNLFRSKVLQDKKTEVIIFVTPQILQP